MKYMNTYKGILIDPLNPTPNAICIEDIAHSLSLLCRGGGHLSHFYSVGQHSINCAREAKAQGLSKRVALACLLHDASEAYLSDIIRPVKQYLPRYYEIEKKFQDAVFAKFNLELTEDELCEVSKIDDLVLINEMHVLMSKDVSKELLPLSGKINLELTAFENIEREFIEMTNSLCC
ncbi:MAG: phosphohydrolase [Suipraeoptans sp.]